MSSETNRTTAYSADMRWRMVYQIEVLNKSYKQVGKNLGVDLSTVYRIVKSFQNDGHVDKKKYPPNTSIAKLTEIDKLLLLETVIEKPDVYLAEVKQLLSEETGTNVDTSTICRFIAKSNFTRKKLSIVAKQRSDILRAEYQLDLTVYHGHPELFVFVDETGADKRHCLRKFGRGKRATCKKLLIHGERISAIGVISTNGLLDCYTLTGTVNSDRFENFL